MTIKRPTIISRIYQAVIRKWRLGDRIRELRFQNKLKDQQIEDLQERLEAYKDALVALDRSYRFEGMVHENNTNRIAKPAEPYRRPVNF